MYLWKDGFRFGHCFQLLLPFHILFALRRVRKTKRCILQQLHELREEMTLFQVLQVSHMHTVLTYNRRGIHSKGIILLRDTKLGLSRKGTHSLDDMVSWIADCFLFRRWNLLHPPFPLLSWHGTVNRTDYDSHTNKRVRCCVDWLRRRHVPTKRRIPLRI